MFLAKVVGTVWSTKKSPDLEGVKFLIVHPIELDKEPTRSIVVVADRLGAGVGEIVMCAYGKAARTGIGEQEMSSEAAGGGGAGVGAIGMCPYGRAARAAIGDQEMSIEAAVVGIVDRVDVQGSPSDDLNEAARASRSGGNGAGRGA